MKSFETTIAAQKIVVMQAWVDGKSIEVRKPPCEEWLDVSTPLWDWDNYDYRVKVEPVVVWIAIYPDGCTTLHLQKNAALAEVRGSDIECARVVKMVEVEE